MEIFDEAIEPLGNEGVLGLGWGEITWRVLCCLNMLSDFALLYCFMVCDL